MREVRIKTGKDKIKNSRFSIISISMM